MLKKNLYVSAGVILDNSFKILLSKRKKNKHLPGYWEFPGGKLEIDETPEVALKRELKEELNIETNEACLAPLTFTTFKYEDFYLVMFLFVCRKWSGKIINLESDEIIWVNKNQLREYKMTPANINLISFIEDII
tara:strand:- start:215 stop:619 length:405 start_codon:yes stop_codon:yes gene_type:complete